MKSVQGKKKDQDNHEVEEAGEVHLVCEGGDKERAKERR